MRRRATLLALGLAALLALPMASAAVDVVGVQAPARTVAGKPFDVQVTLRNDGAARTVYLFGALYDPQEGRSCGASTDPRFRTFTHMVQEAVELPAQSVTTYPAPGDRWQHRYGTADAAARPEEAQLCVFVANASSGPLIDYEDFAATTLSVRARNAAPAASFTWSPQTPRVAQEVTFTAQATDAEGDPVTLAWDFGFFDASGRAVGTGASATRAFYPANTYGVTLIASDGLDETRVSREVTVRAAEAEAEDRRLPLQPLLALVAVLVVGLRRRPS